MTTAADVPRAHTPPGGYGRDVPPPILARCTEALAAGAPDLRGTWAVVEAWDGRGPLSPGHPVWHHVERVEQAGDRIVVTGGGVVHDMVVDGTLENGLDDVMAADHATPLVVAATYDDGALVLRPRDLPDVVVRRWRDGDHLLWSYHTLFTARLERRATMGPWPPTASTSASSSPGWTSPPTT